MKKRQSPSSQRPLAAWHAVLLHPPHPAVEAIARQLGRIGLTMRHAWPVLEPQDLAADVILFDVDTGHDAQFPFASDAPPMPLIALIGSEAPGRIDWALGRSFHAHLLKPVGSAGMFSALMIAARAFERVRGQAGEIATLEARLGRRRDVVRAVLALVARGHSEDSALAALRKLAMSRQLSLEDAAATILAAPEHPPIRPESALATGGPRSSNLTRDGETR